MKSFGVAKINHQTSKYLPFVPNTFPQHIHGKNLKGVAFPKLAINHHSASTISPQATSTATEVATSAAPKSSPEPLITSAWPCRDGQLVKILHRSSSDKGHTLEIIVQGLAENQDAELLWGVYRSSPHSWQHPSSITIPNSKLDELSGAMLSPMQPHSATSQSLTVQIPPGLSPITFAFLISLPQEKKRKFVAPLEGRHFSVLLGASSGHPTPLGPSISSSAAAKKKKKASSTSSETETVNFAVKLRGSSTVALVLLQPPTTSTTTKKWTVVELALDPVLNRTGDTWHISVQGLRNLDSLCYGWRIDGDVSWEGGFRIQPDLILLDPCSPAIVHISPETAPPVQLPSVELPDGRIVLVASTVLSGTRLLGDAGVSLPLNRPLEEIQVLEIDIKSFVQGSKVKHPGTFLGVIDRIDHIKAVGANTVVLAPCYAIAKGAGAHPHSALSLFAPDPDLSTDPTNPAAAHNELKQMVHALHAAGIEVISSLDLTFTADGIDSHPTPVSLRGLDHASYFRPNGVLNCGHPAVQDLVLRALKFWAIQFGIDGFYFMNAENMAQDSEGLVIDAPPLVEALCYDPVLAGLKLVAAPSNDRLLPRGGERGFPHWGLWQQRNAAFARDITALIVETSHSAIDSVAARLTGSADVFAEGWREDGELPGNLAIGRRPSFSFNVATTHNNLGLIASEAADVAKGAVMASGGGHSPSPTTIAKTLLLATLIAQGVPVVNHQDVTDVEMARFVGVVSRLRKKLAGLLLPPNFDSPRDISWHNAHGAEPEWVGNNVTEEGEIVHPVHVPHGGSYLGFSVRAQDGTAVYCGFNPHPQMVTATLPTPAPGHVWLRAVDTGLAPPQDAVLTDFVEVQGSAYGVAGKAGIVLIAAIVEHM